MKWLLTLIAFALTMSVVITVLVAEIMIKLAPLFLLAAIVAAIVVARRRRSAAAPAAVTDQHLDSPWIPASSPQPEPPAPQSSIATTRGRPYRERVYLVRGDDITLATTGPGIALSVTTATPRPEASRHPQPPLRHLQRRRPHRGATRP